MESPIIIYSVNSELAWQINVKYYNDVHFVWCTPDFGSSVSTSNLLNNPPSSQALKIYKTLDEAAKSSDRHSSAISENRMGLRVGVESKYEKGIIDEPQRDAIHYAIENTECIGFKPLLYIIPYEEVKDIITPVAVGEAANPSSTEYKIEELPGNKFKWVRLD